METVKISDEENYISNIDCTWKFFPENKKFIVKSNDHVNSSTYEYKISTNPIEIHMRLLESSHKALGTGKEFSVKDGVVLESELIKYKEVYALKDQIPNLKKAVEWERVEIIEYSNIEVNIYILSKHPEIVSKDDYRKFLRQSVERIKSGLTKVEERLKEKDKTGLQILEGELFGKRIWYPDRVWAERDDKSLEYIRKAFDIPLFDKKSPEYCGISNQEFQSSPWLIKSIENWLNKKEITPNEEKTDNEKSIKIKGFISSGAGFLTTKKRWSLILFFLALSSWFSPKWHVPESSMDITTGDGRIMAAIFMIGGLLLWYSKEER